MMELPLRNNDFYNIGNSPTQKSRPRSNNAFLKMVLGLVTCTVFLMVFLLRVQSSAVEPMSASTRSGGSGNDVNEVAAKAKVVAENDNKGSMPDHHEHMMWSHQYSVDHIGGILNGSEDDNYVNEIQFKPLVISGPSGVGKGTLINKLIEYYNHKVDDVEKSKEFKQDQIHELFGFSVSHTTRGPRPGEVDGEHYHFTNKDEMLKQIAKNEFVEYAEVHGNLYGTSYKSVQTVISSEKICILDIDVQGAKRVKENTKLLLQPHFIFIAPPSIEQLEDRLRGRGTETEEAIQRRIGNARAEMEFGMKHGNFDEVIVNNDLEVAFLHLRQVLEEWYPHLNQIPSPSYEF